MILWVDILGWMVSVPAVGGQVSCGLEGLGWPQEEQLVCSMHLLILQEASLVWEQQGLSGLGSR